MDKNDYRDLFVIIDTAHEALRGLVMGLVARMELLAPGFLDTMISAFRMSLEDSVDSDPERARAAQISQQDILNRLLSLRHDPPLCPEPDSGDIDTPPCEED